MKVVHTYPPNIDQIEAKFHVMANPTVIYCFGDTIFNPFGQPIPIQLMVHERVHSERQLKDNGNPWDWWKKYIDDPKFRFEEELLAHIAEWYAVKRLNWSRRQRQAYLNDMAKRLSGPIYGGMCTRERAKEMIRTKLKDKIDE